MRQKKPGRSSASRSERTRRGKRSRITWPHGRPSERVAAVLEGADEKDSGILSAARLPIYQIACSILELPREKRLAAVEVYPERVKEMIMEEVKRIWTIRKS